MKSLSKISSGVATVAALCTVATGTAQAVPSGNVAFQSNTGTEAMTIGTLGGTPTKMDSPSSPGLSSIGQIAFHDGTNALTTDGPYGETKWALGVDPNSSPSIVSSPPLKDVAAAWTVAFNGHTTHDLWTAGTSGDKNWGVVMAAGSSPSIAGTSSLYDIAFKNAAGYLEVVDQFGDTHQTTDAVAAGASPSIAKTGAPGADSYVIAYRDPSGQLAIVQGTSAGLTAPLVKSYLPASGTNPSVSSPGDGTYVVAWQGSGAGRLNTLDSKGNVESTGETMAPNSSPSIETGFAGGAYKVAYEAANGDLSEFSYAPPPPCDTSNVTVKCGPSTPVTSNVDELQAVMPATSPSLD